MATTRSLIPRLLRAAATRRTATTLLRPHHNLHHHLHTIPTPFLHSHTPNLCNSNRHLGLSSISRRVHSRATAAKSPYRIWPYALTLGCIATGMTIFYQYKDEKPVETRFRCEVPDVFDEEHSVVVIEGFTSPEDGTASQYCFSATGVLAKPQQQVTRNNKITVKKLIVDWCEKGLHGYALTGKVILKDDAADPSKSNCVNQIALSPDLDITFAGSHSPDSDSLKFIFVWLLSFPQLLREGHSVVVKGFVEQITDETEENKLDEIKEVKSDKSAKSVTIKTREEDKLDEIKEVKSDKSVTIKTRDREYHFSADVFTKYIATDAAIEWNIKESREKLRSLVKSSREVGKSRG